MLKMNLIFAIKESNFLSREKKFCCEFMTNHFVQSMLQVKYSFPSVCMLSFKQGIA